MTQESRRNSDVGGEEVSGDVRLRRKGVRHRNISLPYEVKSGEHVLIGVREKPFKGLK